MKNLKKVLSSFVLPAALSLTCSPAFAQNDQVHGTVVDENGDPVIGATVRVAGSSSGTVTDLDGHFTISAGKNASLSISYVGYVTQEVSLKGNTVVKVSLSESAKSLNDVIVIGYGTQKKADLSSSISVLDTKEITKVPGGLSAGLQSAVPGVQVTNGRIHIRGVGSVNNTDPLYVVDGMIGGAVPDENNIASIQILKDAASCAIYGSRGANGVVMITTKRGQAGEVKVDYNGYFGWKDFTHKIDLLSGKDQAELINEEMWNAGKRNASDYMDALKDPEAIGQGYNMFNAITRGGAYQKHNVSISGGSANSSFRITGTYGKDESCWINEGSEDFKMNAVSDFKKGIFGFGETFTISRNVNHNNDMQKPINYKWSAVCPIYDPTSVTGYAGAGAGTDCENPRATADYSWHRRDNVQISGNAWFTAEPVKGLVYRFNFGTDQIRNNDRNYLADYSVGQYQRNTPDTYSMGTSRSNRFLYEHTVTFDHHFGDHHVNAMVGLSSEDTKSFGFSGSSRAMPSSEVLILNATQQSTSKEVSSNAQEISMYSYFGRLMYDYAGKYMLAANIRRDASSKCAPKDHWGTFPSFSAAWRVSQEGFMKSTKSWLDDLKLRASWGQLGNSNITPYQYQNTVSFNTVRYYFNDKENTGGLPMMPSNPDVKWETSTSTDFGFDATFLNNRLSVTADYFFNKTTDMLVTVPIGMSAGFIDKSAYKNAGSIENKGFEINVGWHDKIGDKFNYDLSANLSTVHNEVVELGDKNPIFMANNITCTNVGHSVGQFWGYKTAGLFQTDQEAQEYVNDKGERLQPNAKAGDIRFVDVDGDGKLGGGDQTYIGNPIPTFTYGITASCNYRTDYGTFDFNMVWNGSQGNDIVNYTRYEAEGMHHNYGQFASVKDRFRAEDLHFVNPINGKETFYAKNTNTSMPRAVYGDPNNNRRMSDRYVEDGSYLRLKTLSLGYTLPKAWSQKVYAENVRLYVGGKNLITITDYSGYDPEVGDQTSGGTNLTRGIDGLDAWNPIFPNYKEFYVGLQVTF